MKRKLHIICRFKTLPYIVCDVYGNFYQLEHVNIRTKPFRKLSIITCGGSTGYRINRKFYTLNKLRKLVIKTNEHITINTQKYKLPF